MGTLVQSDIWFFDHAGSCSCLLGWGLVYLMTGLNGRFGEDRACCMFEINDFEEILLKMSCFNSM